MRTLSTIALQALLLLASTSFAQPEPDPLLWPEAQRAFLEDGPGLLLAAEQRERLLAADEAGRDQLIRAWLADPIPATPENELEEGISRRRQLVFDEFLSFKDTRARILFLHGKPTARSIIDCGATFKPMEIWTYGVEDPEMEKRRAKGEVEGPRTVHRLVLYRPAPRSSYQLWLPLDSKRALYTSEMEYYMEQWEELRGRIIGKRIDLQACPETPEVEKATGVEGLTGYRRDRPTMKEVQSFLEPPADPAEWARAAAATDLEGRPPELATAGFEFLFPELQGQRMITWVRLKLPPDAGLEPFLPGMETPEPEGQAAVDQGEGGADGGAPAAPAAQPTDGTGEAADPEEATEPEYRVIVNGLIEHEGQIFEEFRIRYKMKPPPPGTPLSLEFERLFRPGKTFLVRARLKDEASGAQGLISRAFQVPKEPQPVAPPMREEVVVSMTEKLAKETIPGRDSLILVPPQSDVVLGLWRAEALVTGSRIQKVVFLVDDKPQLTRTRPPFTAEVRLTEFPTEQVVRAEGYDADGELVAADEVILNQPKGALRVTILAPRRGERLQGTTTARAEVVVPEGRRVDSVEFWINNSLQAAVERPPWQAEVVVPGGTEMAYLSVVAILDDGSRAEDVRFLNAPQFLEEVDVNLVELYTAVTDGSGRLVDHLAREDFEVYEDKRRQTVTKFELMQNLPLTVCITIDTSGSMASALVEAQLAATSFLEDVITPQDRSFAVAFSDRPVLLVPPTDDVDAVATALKGLTAVGWTTLHDAVVTSLYYFRGFRGQRALILLSDGDDTASSIPFRNALEFARRSGVTIYSIGLDVGALGAARRKLAELAEETGGRSFFIKRAEELRGVYDEIERELRSRYLLAYTSDRPRGDGAYRTVEVKVKGRGLKARTIRGYYP